jgi:hypothetical protein
VPAATVDSICTFQPGFQAGTSGTGPIAYGGAAAYDPVIATNWVTPLFFTTGAVGSYRPVAGCIKVLYTGSELNRAGIVYAGYHTDSPWTFAGGTTKNVAEVMNTAGLARTRLSDHHEVRWIPGPESQEFIMTDLAGNEKEDVHNPGISLGVVGAPAGTISYEVTAVWEWMPDMTSSGNNGIVSAPRAPSSSNTLNDVLRAVGHVGEFIIEGVGGRQNAFRIAASAAAQYFGVGPVTRRMAGALRITG